AARCAFCGDLELSLCSTLVEGPTWEEALDHQLQAQPAAIAAAAATADAVGDTVQAATKRRIAAMGVLTAPSSAAAGLDLTRCQWVPVDKSLRD
ncbi:unnamed protein product, partial [Ectocarpus sp. 8 AP-2014]